MKALSWLLLILCHLLAIVQSGDITNEVFGDLNKYLPAAFGDFDADKLTDVFTIQKVNDAYSVQVLKSYSTSPLLRPNGPSCTFKLFKVINLVPSDFDGDGAMDVLVIVLDPGNPDTGTKALYKAYVLWGNLLSLQCPNENEPILSLKSQPLLLDYNGDMVADLFGEDSSGVRCFWIFAKGKRDPPIKLEMDNPNNDPFTPLKISGGHAFVDLDKDLAADLWIVTEDHFELWFNSDTYTRYETIVPPSDNGKTGTVFGQSTFLDFDLDGDMELILPMCFTSDCDDSKIFVYEFMSLVAKWYELRINLIDENEMKWRFYTQSPYRYTNTITPRIGDFNLDGYPDIILTLFNANNMPKVVLFLNTECVGDCSYPRMLSPSWNTFNQWENTILGTFFDFNDNGNLDILLVNASTDGQLYSTAVYQNAVEYDAMFLKVLVLTGQCYHNCAHSNVPYGTNQPGPSVRYTITTASGSIQESCATQLSQSSHFALQLPYTVFGLGRNWNFVDNLEVGLPKTIEKDANYSADYDSVDSGIRKSTFTQIVPNSQLVVIPYPMDKPNEWITQLFITPSKAMIMTAGAFIATCLLVAAIIGILHLREKREDRKERLQEAQRFHFDAM